MKVPSTIHYFLQLVHQMSAPNKYDFIVQFQVHRDRTIGRVNSGTHIRNIKIRRVPAVPPRSSGYETLHSTVNRC